MINRQYSTVAKVVDNSKLPDSIPKGVVMDAVVYRVHAEDAPPEAPKEVYCLVSSCYLEGVIDGSLILPARWSEEKQDFVWYNQVVRAYPGIRDHAAIMAAEGYPIVEVQ